MSERKKSKAANTTWRWAMAIAMVTMLSSTSFAQESHPALPGVMFYNTENLFDCFDDSLSMGDDDFLPSAPRHWTYNRYKDKLQKTAKVIMAAGQWSPPFLVGLCEIENKSVLLQLIHNTGLSELGYRFCHFESPDPRGIDVALLYKKDCFKVLEEKPISILLANDKTTRDILFVKGIAHKTDTLFVLVNHWPSRLGGEAASDLNRMAAANCLMMLCDSLNKEHRHPSIIAMGDFNDGPHDESILKLKSAGLESLAQYNEQKNIGSNKYRQNWEIIDQIIVSEHLQKKWQNKGMTPHFMIVDLPFLLVKDEAYFGVKPFRTYLGPNYIGGYSDHLPVMVTLETLNVSAK